MQEVFVESTLNGDDMDTLRYSNKLMEAGFSRQQSEVQTQLIKEVLVDDVAGKKEMNAGFSEMQTQFKEMDLKFAAIDVRFKAIDARFDKVDARFDALEARFKNEFVKVHNRIDGLSVQIQELKNLITDRPGLQFLTIVKMMGMLLATLLAVAAALPYLIKVFHWVNSF